MKTILLLYRKQFIENKKTILLYWFVCFAITYVLLFIFEKRFLLDIELVPQLGNDEGFTHLPTLNDIIRIQGRLRHEIQPLLLGIWSVSLCICIHWGIRDFNYSPQTAQYNTLPVSIFKKWFWIISYVFIVLPLMHLLILWLCLQLSYPFLLPETSLHIFDSTQLFFQRILTFSELDPEIGFIFKHLPLFLIVFILLSLQFNRMGFVKTLAGGLVIGIAATLFIVHLNYESSSTYGNFGHRESQIMYPGIYQWYFTGIVCFCLAGLSIIGWTLREKNH